MELRGAIEALKALEAPSHVRLYSDSAYLCNAFDKGWLEKRQRNGWKKSDGKPVKNTDLWHQVLKLSMHHEVTYIHVAGRSGVAGNKRCHNLV
jgi:ribonuclease HI